MTTFPQFIGRREAVGVGIEATPGTPVAASAWMRWLDNSFVNKITPLENESAMGVVARVNDSEIVEKWAEGNLHEKLTSDFCGYLLLGFFGSVADGAAVGGIYPHTFTTNQSAQPKTLTILRSGPSGAFSHSFGTIDSLEISADAGGWVEIDAAVKARVATSTTTTPAFTPELEFTSKNITVRSATTVSGLTSALDLKASHVKVTLNRPSDNFFPLGSNDAPEFDNGENESKMELTVRMTDTQYETDFLANNINAMYVLIANGTTSLKFTASKARYRELAVTRDKDKIVTVTLQVFCEYDTATSTDITTVLNNVRAVYS